jgi:hypothetical protein
MNIAKRNGRRLRIESLECRDLLSLWTVTSAIDGAPGSLRDLVGQAGSGDVIRFSNRLSRATLHLTQGELALNKSITIQGSSQTLDADGLSRIFAIEGSSVDVVLSDLTLTDGKASLFDTPNYAGYAGGAILVHDANITLKRCNIVNNVARGAPSTEPMAPYTESALGGGIAAFDSHVTLERSVLRGNRALGCDNTIDQQAGMALGGGVFMTGLEGGAQLVVIGGKIVDNLAQGGSGTVPIETFPNSSGGWGAGGGVWLGVADASMNDVAVVGNLAAGGNGSEGKLQPGGPGQGGHATGGAVFIQGPESVTQTSTLSLDHVSLVNNAAQGGTAGAPMDNTQSPQRGGSGAGGAIANVTHTTLIVSGVTLDGNRALGGEVGPNANNAGSITGRGGDARGGGIYSETPTRIEMSDSVIRNGIARGGAGANSSPNSGTEAGVGGWAQGGGWFMTNTTGSRHVPPDVLPVMVRHSTFESNLATGGEAGSGTQPVDSKGAGGVAIGGGITVVSVFDLSLLDSRWLRNDVLSGQGKLGFGGALSITYGTSQSRTLIQGDVFSGNRVVGGRDASNVAYREASGGAIMNNAPNTVVRNSVFRQNLAIGGTDTGSGHVGYALGGAICNMLAPIKTGLPDVFSPAWMDFFGGRPSESEPSFEASGPPSLEIYGSVFQSNTAQGGTILRGNGLTEPNAGMARGGAIYHDVATLFVSGGSFIDNIARGSSRGSGRSAEGGAIYAFGYSPQFGYTTSLQLAGVSFTGNRVIAFQDNTARGGAVAQMGNFFEDRGSTYRGNSASASCGGTAYGGALAITNGTARLEGVSVTSNSARGYRGYGGGIAFENDPKAALLTDRVLANLATTDGKNIWGEFEPF